MNRETRTLIKLMSIIPAGLTLGGLALFFVLNKNWSAAPALQAAATTAPASQPISAAPNNSPRAFDGASPVGNPIGVTSDSGKTEHVSGYTRKNGTYVGSYERHPAGSGASRGGGHGGGGHR